GSDHGSPTQPSPSPEAGTGPERPALRLSMLSAQLQGTEQTRARLEQPATAPIHRAAVPLPVTGYFAPRGALLRSNTEQQARAPLPPLGNPFAPADSELAEQSDDLQPKERRQRRRRLGAGIRALRFASRDSVHTIQAEPSEDGDEMSPRRGSRLHSPIAIQPADARSSTGLGIGGAPVMPQGLRRRMTQTRDELIKVGRAFNPAAAESDTESEPGAAAAAAAVIDPEKHMEDLLDRHAANDPENPPTNIIAANNANIASTRNFHSVNPSTFNPGVIHISMSGDSAAKSIVDAILGTVGTSTGDHDRPQLAGATPAELEAGQSKSAGGDDGGWTAHTTAHDTHYSLADQLASMGAGQSSTSLRSVYANLNKLQNRMAEHQKKRDQRMRELRLKEEKRRAEAGRRREETDRRLEAKRRREDAAAPRHESPSWIQREQAVLSTVGARIRDIPDKLAGKRKAWSTTPRTSPEAEHGGSGGGGSGSSSGGGGGGPAQAPEHRSFVVHGSRAMPRPHSVAMAIDSMGLPRPRSLFEDTAQFVPTAEGTPPTRSGGPTATTSPVLTPGWDELLASSGMLSGRASPLGVPGSRVSTVSSDSAMAAFEAERQKILAQLADIFNRQNFLLLASRALMAFGAPLHRLEANLIAVALNLDVQATFAVLPGIILITFGDEDTRSSETYVVRSVTGYDMYRLGRTNRTIRRVLKGRITVGQGVKNIERVLATP
ncbi:pheromone-regulated protein prm10, partial [Coemansia helicoidea]